MSKQRAKGTALETLVLSEFRRYYPQAERRALQGANDKGDLLLPGETRFIVECKNVARMDLAGWHAEAVAEAANAGVPHGVVVHKRQRRGQAGDQWVTLSLSSFLELVNP